jgi:hypothetical protein
MIVACFNFQVKVRTCSINALFNFNIVKNATFFFFIFSAFSSLSLRAQQDGYVAKNLNDLGLELNWSKRIIPPNQIIEGTPYFNDEFIEGEVYFEGKFKLSNLPLRYNINNDEMEFKEKNTVLAIAFPEKTDKVVIGNKTFIYIDKNHSKIVEGFVIKRNEGYPAVLTKMKVDFFDKEPPKAIVDSKPARYEKGYDRQYLMKSPDEIENIKSVKKLIQALGNHEKELTAFAKKEKISSNNGEELASLIEYYKNLQ